MSEPRGCTSVAIGDSATMIGIVLPSVSTRVRVAAGDVIIAIVVDVNVVVVPVDVSPPPITSVKADLNRWPPPEARPVGRSIDKSRWPIIIRWVRRIGPNAIDDRRVIDRYIDHLGISRCDRDRLVRRSSDDLLR